ncbi:GNAT family N-acetyltransferase [Peribacillus frigoritolerans]|uniref:GNAT family N-acetyltransferase n=1 Tax=Peribacillus frigoritolerans TaxID=450367 RepID=UPI001059C98C|nr:GNAT family N-acetyltransferase [Peribacillus frigoritolerans]TDL83009.1 GNAT family N-acetyltransferase [Peribacillus frigoritolerans]
MTVIRLTKERYREAMNLSEYAFQYKVPEEKVENRLQTMEKHHQLFGILEGEELAAKLHLLPLEVYLGETKWKMGGIAGVATYPEYRRSGYVKEMITFLLEYMRKENFSVSMLHPFSVPFYRKYGWELFSSSLKASLKSEDLVMKKQMPGKIRRYQKETHPSEIREIYDEFAMRFSGMLVRETSWWKESIFDDQTAAVYYNEAGEAKGYMLYEVKNDKMTVEEFVPLTSEARIGLWNFICQHDSMIKELEVSTYESDPLFFSLNEPRIKAEVKPYFMARIVDAESFLKNYEFEWPEDDSELIIHIKDQHAPWNNGTFKMKNKEVIKISGSEADGLTLDINTLSAALFGYKRPADLYEIGHIEGEEEAVNIMEALIPSRKAFFYDFF